MENATSLATGRDPSRSSRLTSQSRDGVQQDAASSRGGSELDGDVVGRAGASDDALGDVAVQSAHDLGRHALHGTERAVALHDHRAVDEWLEAEIRERLEHTVAGAAAPPPVRGADLRADPPADVFAARAGGDRLGED